MNDSHIAVDNNGNAHGFIGKDAVSVFAATAVIGGMRLYLKTGMKANRAYTPTNMRAFATRTTGKAYPRSSAGLEAAMADLIKWRDEMRDSLPVVNSNTGEQVR